MVTEEILNFILGPFLVWAPSVFFWLLFVLTLLFYVSRDKAYSTLHFAFLNFRNLIIAAVSFRFLYAFLEMASQYYFWSQSNFTKLFLGSALSRQVDLPFILDRFPEVFQSRLGYFLFYSYGRFWLNVLVVLTTALVFYFFLKALQKYRARFFEEGEPALGFLLAFLAGWPGFLVFIPLLFLAVVFYSVFRQLLLRQAYTTLGWSMLLAGFLTLGWGARLLDFLHLTVFKI